jgi:phosphatidate cytidylyltransferase
MNDKNRNLVARVATAVVLLPLVIWLLLLGGWPFAVLLGAASGLCAVELNRLPVPDGERRRPWGGLVASALAAFLIPLCCVGSIGFGPAAIVGALVIVAFVDSLLFEPQLPRAPLRVGLAVLVAAYPGLALASLMMLRSRDAGLGWIALCLGATWLNDTGAYFAGRTLGRRKLYPRISPSKTWEGFAGGLLASIAGGLVVRALWLPGVSWVGAAAVGAGCGILGPLGDLSESMLKRAFGKKDSSHILPGHGGLLDRIDALLFNAPFVWLCARLLQPPS